MFRVGETVYGGRGYFATTSIPKDTRLLSEVPTLASVFDDFKKEVCVFCFGYDLGKTLKFRVGTCSRACSESCVKSFDQLPGAREVVHALDAIQAGKKRLGDLYYDLLRFCATAIVLHETPAWSDVLALQDDYNLTTKVERDSARGVVNALNRVFPASTIDFEELVRTLLGRSKCNCFGIWQQDNGASFPESEMLGYCLYTASSYFNHSCRPNVEKLRVGREMRFTTSRDIQAGEELVINYLGDREYRDVHERRAALKEWGFTCMCALCILQSAENGE